jgi:hypothetical protein
MSKKSAKAVQAVQDKGIQILAWSSFGFAAIGGTAASGTFVGDTIRTVLDILPWEWVPVAGLIGLAGATAVDLFMDATPNRVALYSAIAIPSVATAAPGKLGDTLTDGANTAMDWVDTSLAEWLGTQSSVGIAITCVVASLILARRVVKTSKPTASAGA